MARLPSPAPSAACWLFVSLEQRQRPSRFVWKCERQLWPTTTSCIFNCAHVRAEHEEVVVVVEKEDGEVLVKGHLSVGVAVLGHRRLLLELIQRGNYVALKWILTGHIQHTRSHTSLNPLASFVHVFRSLTLLLLHGQNACSCHKLGPFEAVGSSGPSV